jgi:hypothetical protein
MGGWVVDSRKPLNDRVLNCPPKKSLGGRLEAWVVDFRHFQKLKPTDSPIDHPTDHRSSLDFSWVVGKITFRPDSPDL